MLSGTDARVRMGGGADHLLLDTVRRRLRHPAGWVAVVLHLSRLGPPAPRPHHRRIARVLLEDAARRHDGVVFGPANGDMLLICRASDEQRRGFHVRVASPRMLPAVLGRLLQADLPRSGDLVSFWPLEASGNMLLNYALDRIASEGGDLDRDSEMGTAHDAADALSEALDGPGGADLLRRQTAVLVGSDGMQPLFHELRFSVATLEGRLATPVRTEADPYLFRHLAERLDRRVLRLIARAVGRGGAVDPAVPGVPRLHLNLTLDSLRSDDFVELAETLAGHGVPAGVEVSLIEACADPDRFQAAKALLRRLNMPLVLDGVSIPALRLARVAALEPDMVKLVWSPRGPEPEPAGEGPEQRLIRDMGADRIVLHHAETEHALRWGVERGLRRFQGRYVDTMLGALRLSGCGFAQGCTLQQCVGRAAATEPGGRRECRNPKLLDLGAPALGSPALGSPALGSPALAGSAAGGSAAGISAGGRGDAKAPIAA